MAIKCWSRIKNRSCKWKRSKNCCKWF